MNNAIPRVLMVVVFLMPWSPVSAGPSLITSRDCDSEFFCPPSLPQVIDGAGKLGNELWNDAGEIFGASIGVAGTLAGWAINQATGVLEPPATGSATPETHIFSGATIDPATGLSKPPATGPATPETPIFGGGTDDQATGLLKPPATGPATPGTPIFGGTPNVNKANTNDPDSTTDSTPEIEIGVMKPPGPTSDCDTASAVPPLLDSNSNLGVVSLGITKVQGCAKATAQIVWTVGCEHTEENRITEEFLRQMDAGVLSSKNPLCAVKGGISFWVLDLTEDQIEQLKREQTQSISAIEPNTPLEPSHVAISPNLMRRDKQTGGEDVPELRFISTKKRKKRNSKSYVYRAPAGAGTSVYLIDGGVNVLHREFRNVNIPKWIFALLSDETYSEGSTPHGTCMASLITGDVYGVSKKVELIPVKIAWLVASFLDAVARVVQDVQEKAEAGIVVRGHTVVNISNDFTPVANDPRREDLVNNLNELTQKYGVVVVTSAGNNFAKINPPPGIFAWPAGLAPSVNIITVGSVQVTDGPDNGKRSDWAVRDPGITVNAPGEGDCASGNDGVASVRGTSNSAARVSGLVAYLLSTEDGAEMRDDRRNLPTAMKVRLWKLSFARYGGEGGWEHDAVSNGLDGDDY
ncbi:hypothetical protein MMC22_002005 [Lobaria immixta]|nr:hypothetical protein [Lobaria immixta]